MEIQEVHTESINNFTTGTKLTSIDDDMKLIEKGKGRNLGKMTDSAKMLAIKAQDCERVQLALTPFYHILKRLTFDESLSYYNQLNKDLVFSLVKQIAELSLSMESVKYEDFPELVNYFYDHVIGIWSST
jgi:hypothetical protein